MTNETLMTTEAATPSDGQPESTPDTQTATGAVEGVQQQATEGQQAEAPAEAQQHEAKPAGAPERYEFTPIEGAPLAAEITDRFSGVAKELNLSQDAAQKVLSEMAPAIKAHQAEQIAAMTSAWAEQSTNDKEFGGANLQENLVVAKKALDTFGTPELRELFNESGLGNHPEVIRFMVRAGKAVSEDKFVAGGQSNQTAESATRFYSASNMNP